VRPGGARETEDIRGAVGLFYDDMDAFYEAVWEGNLHAGLWSGPEDRASLAEAQDRMTDLFIERVRLRPGERLLDVGCGTGVPALRAARGARCRVVGVTVSRAQASRARALALESGLADRSAFLRGEALALPFASVAFDGAWALESIFHFPDRAQALREISRVLRPGARLVLTDIVARRGLDPRQRGIVAALQIDSLAAPGDDPRLLEEAGLECLELEDLSARVQRSIGETVAATDARRAALVEAYGAKLYESMRRLLLELEVLYADKLGYVLVVARKPLRGHGSQPHDGP